MLQMQQSSVITATLQSLTFIQEAEGEGTARICLLFALLVFAILTSFTWSCAFKLPSGVTALLQQNFASIHLLCATFVKYITIYML